MPYRLKQIQCRPWTLSGLSVPLIESHYENNYDRGMGGALAGALHLALLVNGVDINRGNSNGWMNAAMTDKDVDQIVDAFDRSIVRLQEARLLG